MIFARLVSASVHVTPWYQVSGGRIVLHATFVFLPQGAQRSGAAGPCAPWSSAIRFDTAQAGACCGQAPLYAEGVLGGAFVSLAGHQHPYCFEAYRGLVQQQGPFGQVITQQVDFFIAYVGVDLL